MTRQALSEVEAQRAQNMRQLLLRASRIVNRDVVEGLRARGYFGLRSTHTTLLSNIDLAGISVTDAADRAGITKQAMGRLASELAEVGYIKIETDTGDRRVHLLRLTAMGRKLMFDSFEVMAELESHYADIIGNGRLTAILQGLKDFVSRGENDK